MILSICLPFLALQKLQRSKIMRIELEQKIGYRFKVELPSDLVEYAKAFLIITNNARCYSNMIWRVYNNDGNDVYVVVSEDSKDAAQVFLKDLGEIKRVDKVQCFRPIILDMTEAEFNRMYREDIDTEFLEVEAE